MSTQKLQIDVRSLAAMNALLDSLRWPERLIVPLSFFTFLWDRRSLDGRGEDETGAFLRFRKEQMETIVRPNYPPPLSNRSILVDLGDVEWRG